VLEFLKDTREINMHEVKDGLRTLQFEGKLLGKSSSYQRGSTRWIEFYLYKTESGSYVLSRIGVSLIYHGAACPLVKRYGLQEISFGLLERDSIPCTDCRPSFEAELVFPEKHRYWAQVSEEPSSVLEALYKYDQGGARYLTKVAQRLLESASAKDSAIESIYRIEVIP
jgi:hypothetical protein